MSRILLGVTGSVAALRTPALAAALRGAGHEIKVVATHAALYFFDPTELDPSHRGRNPDVVVLDEDEWPGQAAGRRWGRDDPVLHIELRRWADLFAIAPLDANTLAKLALGLADNCLTCVWRAWDRSRPALLAPAMNTLMWEQPVTARHLRQLAGDAGLSLSEKMTLDEIVARIDADCARLRVLPPVSKRLACGDVGAGAMAEVAAIVAAVTASLSQ